MASIDRSREADTEQITALGFEVTALVLPDGLAEAVTAVLTGRDHPTNRNRLPLVV